MSGRSVLASRAGLSIDKAVSAAVKAALVGAKTVNGPVPLKVEVRLAAIRASTRMLNVPSACAVSTMFNELHATTSNDTKVITRETAMATENCKQLGTVLVLQ
jgi:hypothetical protein